MLSLKIHIKTKQLVNINKFLINFKHNHHLLIIYFIINITLLDVILCKDCNSPAVPLNAKLKQLSNEANLKYEANYECDAGYELFGSSKIKCTNETGWPNKLPFCGVNVAIRKPANQSSSTRHGPPHYANNGHNIKMNEDEMKCAETEREPSPWWQVDLLIPHAIKVVRITTKKCCEVNGLQDMEIRVGNSSIDFQRNPLCAWHPGTLDEEFTKTFYCARTIIGQFVVIQLVGSAASLNLCEVEIFSSTEFTSQQCGEHNTLNSEPITNVFLNTCYDFHLKKGLNFQAAQKTCQKKGGDLVHDLKIAKKNFITSELERRKSELQTHLVWIGAQKDPEITARLWKWVNGDIISKPDWGKDQPNNYNGEQNCVVFDGGRNWLWNDVGCNLDYLHFICQYAPLNCGSPNSNQYSSIIGRNYTIGSTIKYNCDDEYALIGAKERICQSNGAWSQEAPKCKYIDCGSLIDPENGKISILGNKTTYGAVATYNCYENFTLIGNNSRICELNGWTSTNPKCITDYCPEPTPVIGAKVIISGTKSGSTAKYECNNGYVLFGEPILTCQLGGKWTSDPPYCKFVDCGAPARPDRGTVILLNNTTTKGAIAKYICDEDHWIIGAQELTCENNGKWSGNVPICELITCETPMVPPGSFVVGYDYNIHSTISYNCDPGYILKGQKSLKCMPNGEWSDNPPLCQYIDCGLLTPIKHGIIEYLQNTTYLGSEVQFSCTNSYHLNGTTKRLCIETGLWTDISPKCEETRCSEPILAPHSILTITGNDRIYGRTTLKTTNSSRTQTYRIGSLAKYRCEKGYKVIGDPLITCTEHGKWSGLIPECIYVDCKNPSEILNGKLTLATNVTYYGAAVHYECFENFMLNGASRRICLHNGSWSHDTPQCTEVLCPELFDNDNYTINIPTRSINSIAVYKCVKGKYMINNDNNYYNRTCLKNGHWSGKPPTCNLIDCKKPPIIENGRIIIINDSTTYGGSAEYHCIPNYNRKGPYLRKCLENGNWSAETPICELNMSESTYDGQNIGIGVGIGAAIIIILLITIAILFYYRNKARPVKNTENVQAAEYVADRNVAVTSYSTLESNRQNSLFKHNNLPPLPPPLPSENGINIRPKENIYDQIPNNEELSSESPYEMTTNEEVYEPDIQPNNFITINGISVG